MVKKSLVDTKTLKSKDRISKARVLQICWYSQVKINLRIDSNQHQVGEREKTNYTKPKEKKICCPLVLKQKKMLQQFAVSASGDRMESIGHL